MSTARAEWLHFLGTCLGKDEESQTRALTAYLEGRVPSRDIRGLTLADLFKQPHQNRGILGNLAPEEDVSPGFRMIQIATATGLPIEVCRALIDMYGNLDWMFELECWEALLTCISFSYASTENDFWSEVWGISRKSIDPVLQDELKALLASLPASQLKVAEIRDQQYLAKNGWVRAARLGEARWV